MEEIKKKRGRPRKNSVPEIPQEIQSIIEEGEKYIKDKTTTDYVRSMIRRGTSRK